MPASTQDIGGVSPVSGSSDAILEASGSQTFCHTDHIPQPFHLYTKACSYPYHTINIPGSGHFVLAEQQWYSLELLVKFDTNDNGQYLCDPDDDDDDSSVCCPTPIIGGGIGGTSAAFFIHDLFGSNGAQIDLYESNRIGGRLATIEVNNQKYEAGGSILHPRNKYMSDFVKLFGLKKRINDNFRYGIYDGEEFVFTESQWEIMNYIKLVWRYGLGPLKLQNYIDDILTRFER
uniref:Prenylcysteine lyase domain-containing protein n=1 Tax=Timema cristinae TaxID=61476 RepID=A0A7R9CLH4_TIMCR|nr:unnamed protein product [Timema cristinae]